MQADRDQQGRDRTPRFADGSFSSSRGPAAEPWIDMTCDLSTRHTCAFTRDAQHATLAMRPVGCKGPGAGSDKFFRLMFNWPSMLVYRLSAFGQVGRSGMPIRPGSANPKVCGRLTSPFECRQPRSSGLRCWMSIPRAHPGALGFSEGINAKRAAVAVGRRALPGASFAAVGGGSSPRTSPRTGPCPASLRPPAASTRPDEFDALGDRHRPDRIEDPEPCRGGSAAARG